jgi:GH15 family glucan-1,4-alpha-glucosidase
MSSKAMKGGTATYPYPPIADYALIGDCRAAALVSREGSLDWLCWPRFDSPSVFAALLDATEGGRFRIRPTGAFRSHRRYISDTNVLETTFETPDGVCVLRDLMPAASEEEKRAQLTPEHEVLREVEGLSGEVELEVLYQPRPDYGRTRPALRHRGALGLWCHAHDAVLVLHGDISLQVAADGCSAHGQVQVCPGERRHLSLSYAHTAPAVILPPGSLAHQKIEQSARWWQTWAGRCIYQGPYREMVVRSALVLKLMAHAPSGAVVAAPTTSLPEKLGGIRNWDYRYCWLRDASFTLRALAALGYQREADAFLSWMLHATRLTWPELMVLYDVYGEAQLPEHELPHLEGYARSRPVRIGNDAQGQLQLDVYGEVIDAAARFTPEGGRFDGDTLKLLEGLGQTVCKRWREPDEGIWEGRGGRFHHTHSRVLCWVALDRLIRMHDAGHIDVSVDQFRAQREMIRAEIEQRGYNDRLQSYTRTLDGEDLDASLLTLPLYGYLDGRDARMRSTYQLILKKLGRGGVVYRYPSTTDDGLPAGEGAFGICSFWAVERLALAGELEQARKAFERLLGYANDIGLYAEEVDPDTGAALGNFPQAFTHVGLINAALTLAECEEPRAPTARAAPPARMSVEQD